LLKIIIDEIEDTLPEEKPTLDNLQFSTINISDASFLGNNVDGKILSKMKELKLKAFQDDSKSFLNITESIIDQK